MAPETPAPQLLGPEASETRASSAGAEMDSAAPTDSMLLRTLNDEQRRAVTAESNPLRILAGAGSGKTRVLTHRIAWRASQNLEDPNKVLAVTFTRKAAKELRDRLSRLGLSEGVKAGTFHAIAHAQLRQRWEERGVRPAELLDRKYAFVARLMRTRSSTLPLDVIGEIEWASARMVEPSQYAQLAAEAQRNPPMELAKVAAIYERYMEAKLKNRLVDFDDILRLAARDLAADPVYASARRWRYRHLYVDEFQDVNPLQHHLLRQWIGTDSTLCVVGDPNQAIYAWNGADSEYLIHFDRHYGDVGRGDVGGDQQGSVETVQLSRNYRSTPEILAAANSVLAGSSAKAFRLKPSRPSGAPAVVRAFADEVAEAKAIARSVRSKHRPESPWSTQAVLVRTNSQTAVIAEALTGAGIPHRVRGSVSLLEQPEVKDALRHLNSCPDVPTFIKDTEETVRSPSPELSEERIRNLEELIRLANEFLTMDSGESPPAFSKWLSTALRNDDAMGGDCVEVTTFHAAKGLEWPVVHVAGLEEGLVPIHHSRDDVEAIEEERRLLYVALTRARDELSCTWANRRTFGSRQMNRSPSPWVEPIKQVIKFGEDYLKPGAGGSARPNRAAAGRKARSGKDSGRDASSSLFQELRAWRVKRSRAADVPAFVILNDASLHALAQKRPTRKVDLLDIPGIGAVKADRFGDELLAIIRAAPSD